MAGEVPSSWEEFSFFKEREFRCRCGCGLAEMSFEFVHKLDLARGRLGAPLTVPSGFRCAFHNQRVSSTGVSGPHTTGRAADLLVFGDIAWRLIQIALDIGFTGIGLQQKGPHDARYIHLDDLPARTNRPRPWIWTY